jgi:hypothetical protein
VNTFAGHLEKTFKSNDLPQNEGFKTETNKALKRTLQIIQPIKFLTLKEIRNIIQEDLSPRKAPGYDLITGRILKEMPTKGIVHLTTICNAIIRTGYFPVEWNLAQIIMIPKPGNPIEDASSYRPISLLPIMSKIFEKALLKRLRPILEENRIPLDHQFVFRQKHSTIEKVHLITEIIYGTVEKKQYCSAAFVDFTQAFYKAWLPGLLFKIRKILPQAYYRILESYLTTDFFKLNSKMKSQP